MLAWTQENSHLKKSFLKDQKGKHYLWVLKLKRSYKSASGYVSNKGQCDGINRHAGMDNNAEMDQLAGID